MSAAPDDTPPADEPAPPRRRRRHHHRPSSKPLFQAKSFRWWHVVLAIGVGVIGALALLSTM